MPCHIFESCGSSKKKKKLADVLLFAYRHFYILSSVLYPLAPPSLTSPTIDTNHQQYQDEQTNKPTSKMTRTMTPVTTTTIRQMVLSLLLLLPSMSAAAPNCILSDPIPIHKDGSVTMEQAADYDAGTFTMRITYTGGRSYVGIGVNLNGGTGMIPAKAVIGRGYEEVQDGTATTTTTTTVLQYDLYSDAKDGSGVVPFDPSLQTLSDTSFVQTESTSILTFTQPLQDETAGLAISDSSSWIFAVGLPNNEWQGKHSIHGSFSFALTPCVYPATTVPTTAPVAAPVVDSSVPGTPTITSENGGGGDDVDNPNNDNDSNNNNGDQETSTTISGDDNNTSNAVNNNNNLGIVFFNTDKPYRKLWAAHGLLMALAWGICAPLGIGAAVFLRRLDAPFQQWAASHPNHLIFKILGTPKGLWYQIHFYMNLATLGLTLLGFLLAYIATAKEEGAFHLESRHHKIGWAITILCVAQASLAYFRPALPPPATTTTTTTTNVDSTTPSKPRVDGDDVEVEMPFKGSDGRDDNVTGAGRKGTGGGGHDDRKSLLRVAWEWNHRLLGILLLLAAWLNCLSGIELDVENFPGTHDKSGAFGGGTGGICTTMAVLAFMASRS
jgi:hypothetical protein